MLDKALLSSVATQLMTKANVEVQGKVNTVRHTRSHRLRTAGFTVDGDEYQAIEQNPDKPSRWGELARKGHQVVQFKNVQTNRFVAVAVDGKVTLYGSGRGAEDSARQGRTS